jgi:hypothetical protein
MSWYCHCLGLVPELLLVQPLKKNIPRSTHCFTSIIVGGYGEGEILSYCYQRKHRLPIKFERQFSLCFPKLSSPTLIRETDSAITSNGTNSAGRMGLHVRHRSLSSLWCLLYVDLIASVADNVLFAQTYRSKK